MYINNYILLCYDTNLYYSHEVSLPISCKTIIIYFTKPFLNNLLNMTRLSKNLWMLATVALPFLGIAQTTPPATAPAPVVTPAPAPAPVATPAPAAKPATPVVPAAPAAIDHSYKPMMLKLSDDGKKFIRFITWHQIWATATQNNPGTRDVNNKLIDDQWSTGVAIRRSRFLIHAQISPRFLILSHWGINNQSFINGGAATANLTAVGASNAAKRPQLYMHDAWTEFAVVPGKLSIGAGLHYWNGISRLSNNSTLNIMTLDAPIFNWPNIEVTDQFARQMGIYAKGQIAEGRLDYRLHLNKPFVSGTAPAAVAKNGIAVNVLNENWSQGGYAKYMLWDKESNLYPFEVGTYLGGKKILNIGAGFYRHAGATLTKTASDSTNNTQLLFGADAIMELPLDKAKGTMFHALLTYYNYNFGKNYIRNVGILNEHTTATPATVSWAGGGNLQPIIGTGSIVYGQFGYLAPKMKNGQAVMPYATVTYKSFERLADPSTQFGIGLNYFVGGHNAKITAEYQTRPIYTQAAAVGGVAQPIIGAGSKGQFILQTHIFL
jgi:hypothetical protein